MASDVRDSIRLNADSTLVEYYTSPDKPVWIVAISDIVLLAEYTTNEGPYLDDYFLVFVTIQDGRFYFADASFYSDGSDQVIKAFAKRWSTGIEFGLVNSTEWKSRVLWPPELMGQDYYEFREVPMRTILEKVRKVAFGPIHDVFLSTPVRD